MTQQPLEKKSRSVSAASQKTRFGRKSAHLQHYEVAGAARMRGA